MAFNFCVLFQILKPSLGPAERAVGLSPFQMNARNPTLRKAFLDRKFCTLFSKDSNQAFSVHTFLLFDGKQHSKAELLQLKLIHLFARELFLMKKLEIEKTKPTFIISVLKVEYQVVLVSSISNFFINKMSLANKWMRKK